MENIIRLVRLGLENIVAFVVYDIVKITSKVFDALYLSSVYWDFYWQGVLLKRGLRRWQ